MLACAFLYVAACAMLAFTYCFSFVGAWVKQIAYLDHYIYLHTFYNVENTIFCMQEDVKNICYYIVIEKCSFLVET